MTGDAHVGAPPIFLSIVLTGRNDGYGQDFRERFFRTLGFNVQALREGGVVHEIVFVEWAPPAGQPYLVDLARDQLPELASSRFTGYVVDPRYHDALSINPRLEYLEFVAKNVGIRRARGRFVLTSNCDVFLGRHIVHVLGRGALEAGVLYRAARHDLKLSTDYSRLSWAWFEESRNLEHEPPMLKPPFMGGGTGDFVLLDRDTFAEIRGFNEVYRAARIGIDRNLLVKAVSAGIPIEDIGGPVYHVNHVGSFRLSRTEYTDREADAPWGDSRWHAGGVVYVNPPAWGLEHAPQTRRDADTVFLEFSWDAVPPLVDLRRIVLPVARVGGPVPGRFVTASQTR